MYWRVAIVLLFILPAGCSRFNNPEIPASAVEMVDIEVADTDWPWWRGKNRDGHASDQDVPTTWSTEKNILWKTDLPGRGHSSPAIWANRIFLTTADDQSQRQQLLCLNRQSGTIEWTRTVHEGGFMRMHSKNSQASASPACDADRVYVVFNNDGAIVATAYNHDGELAWRKSVGNFRSKHGYGSSPVLFQSLLIVAGDNDQAGFIAALDRKTGELVWRKSRPNEDTYATPVVARVAGRDQLLISGAGIVASYNPVTGEELWRCSGPTATCANTVAFFDDYVIASGGYPDKEILCIRADGRGDVTDSHIVWRSRNGVTYVPSPVCHNGLVYIVNDNGIATCFEGRSGNQLWSQRLGGSFSASPVLVKDKLYVPDETGKLFVFKAGRQFELLAQNDLNDGGFASPVICGNRIYLRTLHALYCIGEKSTQ
ncbi:MAG: serine/threonine protein kinase [Gemmatales bacterium]|nr:MAG: serine/threonine protein kinase [Gemmatales bacterium]